MDKEKSIKQFSLLPLQAELIDCLRWFTQIRWLAVAGVLGTVLAARWIFGFRNLPMIPLLSLTFLIWILNFGYLMVSRKYFPSGQAAGEGELNKARLIIRIQIILDLAILTLLLHFSGGVHNPFSFFYIFHVVISSILLPRRTAYAYSLLIIALYAGLILIEQSGFVKTYPVVRLIEVNRTYLLGVIFAFGTTVLFAAYVTTGISYQLQQREEEVEKAGVEMLAIEEQKSSFMRMVSHELRSPIAAIQSSLAVLLHLEEKCMDDGMRRSIERAADRAKGLFQLTKDLLEFSRLTTLDPKVYRKMDFDLRKVVRNIQELYKHQATDKNLDFAVSVPEDNIMMCADPQSIDQMLDNLVSNAIRYTRPGGKVRVELLAENETVKFIVTDTGIGIPAEDIDRIGEEFYRSRNAKQFEPTGTGIGMRIVRETIRLYGGKLNVQSKEGEGTVFRVELPLKQSDPGGATAGTIVRKA